MRDDVDRQRFVETLAQACVKTGWKLNAYCLLPDHFHLVVETPQANLVDGMKWFLGTYTARFNRRHTTCGHLFSGRYRSQVLEASDPLLRWEAVNYVHHNPVRLGLVPATEALGTFAWSSYPAYPAGSGVRPAWLDVDPVLQAAGVSDEPAGLARFAEQTEQLRTADVSARWERFRHGWYVGGESFRKSLLEHLIGLRDDKSTGSVWRASAEQQAEKVIERSLRTLGWQETELTQRAKTDPEKVFIAREIRKETTLPLTWIAERLQMGSRNTLRNALAAPEVKEGPFRVVRPRNRLPRGGGQPARVTPIVPASSLSTGPESSMNVEPGWD